MRVWGRSGVGAAENALARARALAAAAATPPPPCSAPPRSPRSRARARSPNTITALGLALQVAAYCALVSTTGGGFASPAPAWAVACAAAALFAYSTLDNMDGKQARRVGASSPLGLLFDHGCDAVNTATVGTLAFSMAIAAARGEAADAAGNPGLRLVYAIWAVLCTAFFMNTWEEYHIRECVGGGEGARARVGAVPRHAPLFTRRRRPPGSSCP